MTTVDNLQKLEILPEKYQNLVKIRLIKKRKIGNVRKVRQLGKDYSNESIDTKYWKLTTMSGGEAYQQIKELTDMKIKDPNFSMEDMGSRLLRNDTISVVLCMHQLMKI